MLLTDKQPSDGWSLTDKKLAIAFQILEEETCPDCGIPLWIGHSDDENIVFEIKSTVCYSCAEVEAARDKPSKRKDVKGKKRNIVIDPASKVPSRRTFFEKLSGIIS
jgi:hypothetical protein